MIADKISCKSVKSEHRALIMMSKANEPYSPRRHITVYHQTKSMMTNATSFIRFGCLHFYKTHGFRLCENFSDGVSTRRQLFFVIQ